MNSANMSNSDLKYTLRKYEFPQCAKEALIKTEQILTGRSAPSNKQLDLSMEIISEFIFCESDRRSGRRGSGLNPLQELQLIDVICDYLSGNITETARNTIFLSLFLGTEKEKRMKVLCTLASMAVSAACVPMLLAVGTWLQQTGCSSPQSLQLTESLIRDHFYLQSTNQASLKSLATSAAQFVANFITAVTELYLRDKDRKMPPRNLLEIITNWVFNNPTLCMSAQLNPTSLPSGAIPMAAVTPLAGLIHWCALAPLYLEENADQDILEISVPIKRIKLEGDKFIPNKIASHKESDLTESELYKKLHLGVLHSLRAGKRSQGPPTAVNAQSLTALVNPIQNYARDLLNRGVKLTMHGPLQECLERIGQATQVALAHGFVYGNISNLLSALYALPKNRLLSIIVTQHQHTL